jgi:hypothetical protein
MTRAKTSCSQVVPRKSGGEKVRSLAQRIGPHRTHRLVDRARSALIVVLVVAAAHALYFLLLVNSDTVKAAARTYARQLMLSCEVLLVGAKPPAKAKK